MKQSLLLDFLERNKEKNEEIFKCLSQREFSLSKNFVISFLKDAALQTDCYKNSNSQTKKEFLFAVSNAWEVADAINIFNKANLGEAYEKIKIFSKYRLREVLEARRKDIKIQEDLVLWCETLRNSLVSIGEEYRLQNKLLDCKKYLQQIIDFVNENFETQVIESVLILGQCFYYLAKINRFEGDVISSEKHLLITTLNYHRIIENLLPRSEFDTQGVSLRFADNSAIAEKHQINDLVEEVQLRIGVTEVSWAWLYFNKRNYSAALHSAQNALLLLSPSTDQLIKAHAKLVKAAIARTNAHTLKELSQAVDSLENLRKFFQKKKHKRLQSRTEYELVLTLIVLDSKLDDESNLPKELFKYKAIPPRNRALDILTKDPVEQPTSRWQSLSRNLKGRIFRRIELKKPLLERDFSKAIKYANEAFGIARAAGSLYCQIEALICLGEIHFQEGIRQIEISENSRKSKTNSISKQKPIRLDFNIDTLNQKNFIEESKDNFVQALGLCLEPSMHDSFIELLAITRLYLARIANCQKNFGEFEYHWQEYKRLGQFNHSWLLKLENRVLKEHSHSNKLQLELNSLIFTEAELELKRFLIDKAENELNAKSQKINDTSVSDLINIQRQTLKSWREQIK